MPGEITVSGDRFHIVYQPDAETTQTITRIPGRQLRDDFQGWTAPLSQVAAVREAAQRHNLQPLGMARILFHQVPEPPTVRHVGNTYQIRFDYRDQHLAQQAARAGARWFEPTQSWVASDGVRVAGWAALAHATVDPAAQAAITVARTRYRAADASAATTTDWYPTQPLGIELYDEQRAGVQYAIEIADARCIIGDEPGVGKTAQALAIINELQTFPAFLVVPGSLKLNWRREINRALPGKSVEILHGRKPQDRMVWADITILNYDIIHAWLPYLPSQPAAVIGDEFHMIKNPGTQRTQATVAFMARSTGPRLGLTGTTFLNDVTEASPQLEAIGRLEEFGGRKFGATYKTAPIKLNQDLRATCYVRRLKKDVWKDAPDRRWIPVYVEGDPDIMHEYREAERDIIRYIEEQARAAAIKAGATAGDAWAAAFEAGIRANAAQHLVAITNLKQIAARAKLQASIDFARTFLQTGEKLGVYAWHTHIVDTLAEQLHGVKVQGGMTDTAKDTAVRAFQTAKDVRVFVGQIATAGLGLTLTAASKAMVLEQGWSPGIMDQVLDRHHRRGQEHDVVGWLMLIEHTVDEDIYELIKAKRKIVDQATDGFERAEQDGGTVLADLLVRMARRGMDSAS
jgi:SWI/SNF-related matrix-associated actin-dependent regulator 1 of chromatin subfamily A